MIKLNKIKKFLLNYNISIIWWIISIISCFNFTYRTILIIFATTIITILTYDKIFLEKQIKVLTDYINMLTKYIMERKNKSKEEKPKENDNTDIPIVHFNEEEKGVK